MFYIIINNDHHFIYLFYAICYISTVSLYFPCSCHGIFSVLNYYVKTFSKHFTLYFPTGTAPQGAAAFLPANPEKKKKTRYLNSSPA